MDEERVGSHCSWMGGVNIRSSDLTGLEKTPIHRSTDEIRTRDLLFTRQKEGKGKVLFATGRSLMDGNRVGSRYSWMGGANIRADDLTGLEKTPIHRSTDGIRTRDLLFTRQARICFHV
ncbi:hypothetical protein CDAR_465551 [Caerostris darwini]|uniref:Uncharacterized protein n=1 Tax=Caerostris darwini TaxID=1538125 RepID=A0AAV4VIU6_9ARAC|nr:hypothetical protein CDAR_465551 [Caerostris darwini]